MPQILQREGHLACRTKGMATGGQNERNEDVDVGVRALPHFRIGVRKKLPFTYCRMIQLPKKTIGCQRHLILLSSRLLSTQQFTLSSIIQSIGRISPSTRTLPECVQCARALDQQETRLDQLPAGQVPGAYSTCPSFQTLSSI
jgi:hypothetical protein